MEVYFSLHWSGGLKVLEPANRVLEFSSFESAPRKDKKGKIVISGNAMQVAPVHFPKNAMNIQVIDIASYYTFLCSS